MAGPSLARFLNSRGAFVSVRDEAVEQPSAARALQPFLAAAPRAVRGVPGHHMAADLEAHMIVMPDDRRPVVAALCPIAAGRVFARSRIHALRVRTGQHVVRIHRVDPAGHDLAFLGQGGLLVQIGVLRMEVVDVLCDSDALDVLPRALANPIAGVDTGVTTRRRGAEIGAPILLGVSNARGERSAMRVRPVKAAEVGALARADAGEEEGHVFWTSRLGSGRHDEQASAGQ
jgi:hypothetical protein